MTICDYCNLPMGRDGKPTVHHQGNQFHDACWNWMERQKRLHARRQAVGSEFRLIKGDNNPDDDRDQT